jgi:hypothetical protein
VSKCGCGPDPDSGEFSPCCQEHEWAYVRYLITQKLRNEYGDLTITEEMIDKAAEELGI